MSVDETASLISLPGEDATDIEEIAAAARVFLLVVSGEIEWVNRRVESISFNDDDTATRRVSVDFYYPESADGAPLPLALRHKGVAGSLEVRGQAGERLPIRSARESALIVYSALVFAARRCGIELDEEVESLLLEVALVPFAPARAAAKRIEDLEPRWSEEPLRHLLELAGTSRPVFVSVDPDLRRQVVELSFPAMDLLRPRGLSVASRFDRYVRGRVSVFTPLFDWPRSASNHLRIEAPSMAEIAGAQVYRGGSRPSAYEPRSDLLEIQLARNDAPPLGLRVDLSLRPALNAGLLTVMLVLLGLLAAVGTNALSGFAFGTATIALLSAPAVFLARALTSIGVRPQGLYASLLRLPTTFIAIGIGFGLAAIAFGDGGTAGLPLLVAIVVTFLPVPILVRTLLKDAAEHSSSEIAETDPHLFIRALGEAMNEEVPDSTFVLTEPETPVDVDAVPVPEEIRTVARQVTRMGEDGWRRGEGLDSLVAIETAAERVDCSVSDLEAAIKRGELLVVDDTDGERKVPAFQLAVEPDVLAPIVLKVSEQLVPVCASSRTVWLWFLSPKDDLGGKSPAQWLSDGEDEAPLLLTATRDARRLGR